MERLNHHPPSRWRNAVLDALGLYFLTLGLFSTALAMYLGKGHSILSFCYPGLVLVGLGIILRNGDLLAAQLNVFTIPILIWNADFWSHVISGQGLIGVTAYFWQQPFISKLDNLQHIYTVPLSFLALSLIKVRSRTTWRLAMIEMTLLFFLSRYFDSPGANINCVYSPYVNISFPVPYPVAWFAVIFMFCWVTNAIMIRIPVFVGPPVETSETKRSVLHVHGE